MDHEEERAAHKKKEREREKAEEKRRDDEHDREVARGRTVPRHIWFIAIGAALVIVAVLTWTFLF